MTEQSKISRDKASEVSSKGSLFERASTAYGFDALAPAKPPRGLPPSETIAPRPVPREITEQAAHARQNREEPSPPRAEETAQPKAVRAVSLGGSHQSIDRDRMREAGLIVPEDAVTGLLEEFRIVKRELLADARRSGSDKARRILVSSPHPNEGKTYCAVNLAIALAAERDVEVLLVDADVVKPSVPQRLGLESGPGFMDALADHALQPERLAIGTDIEGLFVLPAGTRNARDAEYLASARTGEVLERLTRGAPNRFVVFDTPPALAASAAAELASHVGQTVLIARADETSQAALEDSHQLLSSCPDIKLLLNAAQFSPSGRRFGDYGDRGE